MFITFEGIEGSGKTTQRQMLCKRLREETGFDVVEVREPGSTDMGERLRHVLLHGYEMPPVAEALIVCAARAALVQQVIKPALDRGAIVVCDRYVDSTMVIQGYGLNVPAAHLRFLCGISSDKVMPDLTIYLDITARDGYARKKGQDAAQITTVDSIEFNHLDERLLSMGEDYRRGYRDIMLDDPQRWYVIDSATNMRFPQHDIAEKLYHHVTTHPKFLDMLMLESA
jgi:dTMP kinase